MSSTNHPALDVTTPIAFAHRGGAALAPENTMAAFRNAYRLGCRFMETDCHVTRDGAVVLIHDPTVDRTTDGTGRVAERTLAELRRLDAGVRFDASFAGARIPTFDELVELAPDVRINVELKTPDAIDPLADLLDRRALADRVVIAAEDHATMTRFRARTRGRYATSASRREIVSFLIAARLRRRPPNGRDGRLPFDALQVPTRHKGIRVVDRAFVDLAHSWSVQVHVWTVDDPPAIRDLVQDRAVDGVMSDRPDLLTAVLGTA